MAIRLSGSTIIDDSRNVINATTVLVGSASSTGITNQRLQVSGGAYIQSNVGIGTTNPQSILDILASSAAIYSRNTSTTSSSAIFAADDDYFTNFRATFIEKKGTSVAGNIFSGIPNANLGVLAFQNTTNALIYTNGGTPLIFGTTSLERMRISSSGNIGVGTNNPNTLLEVYGTSRFGGTVSSGRRVDISTDGFVTIAHGNNTASPLLTLDNVSDIGATTNHGGLILWRFGTNTTTTAINAGRINVLKEQQWTTTASTQDAYMSFDLSTDGSLSEKVRITSAGNVGIATTNPQYKLEVLGSFAATTKSFVIVHPTKEGKKLRYASLEGPENGVYVRGRTQSSIIELPDYWTGLVDETSITVNLTPIGESATPRVKEVMNNQVVVFTKEEGELDYYYTIFAERKDVEKLEVEI